MPDSARVFALISSLFESLPEATVLCDRELGVVTLNRAACELLDVGPPKPRQLRIDQLLGSPVPGELRRAGATRTTREWSTRIGLGTARRSVKVRATTLAGGEGWAFFLHGVGLTEEVPPFVGRSAVTQELLEFVSRIAASRASSILLEAETGAGKEVIARRLHTLSPRSRGRFVAVNCAAMPEPLLESELFGYEKGAFTDARAPKQGLIEAANGGTLFLDEIGEMPLGIQAKVLRVLEERTVRRLGGVQDSRVDVRVIAATNRDLVNAIENRGFRSDLYYRLNVVQIRIPPLRDRSEDIEDLALHFLDYFNGVHATSIKGIHPRALRLLKLHQWPGNVRELRNVIERAVLVEMSSTLHTSSINLPEQARRAAPIAIPPLTPAAAAHTDPASLLLRNSERDLVAAALTQAAGNQTRAAALLGIGRFSLRYKMRKFGLL